jgi:predicted Fe-Mo cluster-binding NifX family protein
MKIAISSTGNNLDSQIDSRFGRCTYLVLVETDDMSVQAFINNSATQGGGAGIQSGQFVASKGVKAVITGNCGPNAFQTLNAAGIELYGGQTGTVRTAVENFKKGLLAPTNHATAPEFAGRSQAPSM